VQDALAVAIGAVEIGNKTVRTLRGEIEEESQSTPLLKQEESFNTPLLKRDPKQEKTVGFLP
jgi:hypothetical protein